MAQPENPFVEFPVELSTDDFAALERRDVSKRPTESIRAFEGPAPAIGVLHGFDVADHPMVASLPMLPGQVLIARTTVPLRRSMIGKDVVVLFVGGDFHSPIIMGVIESRAVDTPPRVEPAVTVQIDGDRHLIQAEREIVLRCGDASITLTRAGKVIIEGKYISSRSTGYNKLKGAAVDIN